MFLFWGQCIEAIYPGVRRSSVRLGFGGESRIIAREGNLEAGAEKLAKLVG